MATDNRIILGAVKQVYSGALSGYLEKATEEEAAIETFIRQARRCENVVSKSLKARRKLLASAAGHVVNALGEIVEDRVKAHLVELPRGIMELRHKMAFNSITQNCQSFG